MARGIGLSVVVAAWLAGPALAQDAALHLAENPVDIAILGEVHDNPQHHRNQAAAIATLAPTAVVFEMLTPEQAARARDIDPRDAKSLARALDWANSGWPDFALYAPVFAHVPKGGIRGAALPRDHVRRAMTEGAAAVFGTGAAQYGLARPLPKDQAARLAEEIGDDHCGALPDTALPGMVEAQRLRDAAFARATLAALSETGGPVVLITGTGHARKDRAVPAMLAKAAPEARIFALGQSECDGQTCTEAGDAAPDLYDMLILTAPTPRPDPCLAFRKP
ncbi:ChaN family lipoprotein [Paracoccus sp. p3-h83]|uniref:ChaN family lipoprotein n=1 Tax=Paracoccus sp. p3-h83 TaxID=3342805 RepID=UPI0035B9FD1B